MESLIQFPLSFIPSGAEINSATFKFYRSCSSNSSNDPLTISLMKATDYWSESEVTWDTKPSLIHHFDFEIPNSGSVGVNNLNELDLTSLVQEGVSYDSNNGVILSLEDSGECHIRSSEYSDESKRPALEVSYQ